jgi:hypothetical protein
MAIIRNGPISLVAAEIHGLIGRTRADQALSFKLCATAKSIKNSAIASTYIG